MIEDIIKSVGTRVGNVLAIIKSKMSRTVWLIRYDEIIIMTLTNFLRATSDWVRSPSSSRTTSRDSHGSRGRSSSLLSTASMVFCLCAIPRKMISCVRCFSNTLPKRVKTLVSVTKRQGLQEQHVGAYKHITVTSYYQPIINSVYFADVWHKL